MSGDKRETRGQRDAASIAVEARVGDAEMSRSAIKNAPAAVTRRGYTAAGAQRRGSYEAALRLALDANQSFFFFLNNDAGRDHHHQTRA